MRFETLNEWLSWQESLHPSEIELGLTRVHDVARRAHLDQPAFPVITVAGTNGKGSSVAMLEAILTAAGYRVGTYTSPHLFRYNERIHIGTESVDDGALIQAFDHIDRSRGEISLTYFEFGTLAAMHCFMQEAVDVAVLEVGLGGRLDAVNIWDADVALVTAIDLDHADWLGNDREQIGREKAGIFRPGHPAVCADPEPPTSIAKSAEALGTPLFQLGETFRFELGPDNWSWYGPQQRCWKEITVPALRGLFQLNNAAGVLMVLDTMRERLPIGVTAIREGLARVQVPGRFQVVPGAFPEIFDVAHNPQSARELAANLRTMESKRILAVFSALADKAIDDIVSPFSDLVAHWYIAPVQAQRTSEAAHLRQILRASGEQAISDYGSIREALQQARSEAVAGDIIVVFGSFYTVAEGLAASV